MKLRSKLIVAVILAGAAFGGMSFYRLVLAKSRDSAGLLHVSGNIEVTDAEVAFKIAGRVEKRTVEEGQLVKAGEAVAQLDSSDLSWEVALRRAELEAARIALAELEAGSRPEEIAAAEAAMDKAQALLTELETGSRAQEVAVAEATLTRATVEKRRLEGEFKRAARLLESHAISMEEYEARQAAYQVSIAREREAAEQLNLVKEGPRQEQIQQARAALAQAKAQYQLVKAGPRQEAIEQARARVKQAEAALRLAETRLGYATLVSPLSGIVLSENVEAGEYVAPGTPVVTVGDLENVWLRAYVQETDLGRVKVGQRVRVTTDTYPGKVYEGRVSFVASKAEFTPKNVQTQQERVKLVYRVKVDIPNPNMELKPGMPADAEILLTTEEDL